MSLTHAAIRDLIEQKLQDTGNATWTTGEIDGYIRDALKAIAYYRPHETRESFTIESRKGTATATTASKLVDSTKSQFVSGDVNKVVFNDTDNTWAIITAYDSATTLSLSKNIMASGEDYKIFNKGCRSNREINIEDIGDFLSITNVEYPIMQQPPKYQGFQFEGSILYMHLDQPPADSDPTLTPARNTEVFVYVARAHRLNEMTDLAGAVNLVAGYAAGDTSMVVDGLEASGTVRENTEFTMAVARGLYRVTANATIATNEATISFWPGLANAVANNDVVTFIGSTLSAGLEDALIDWATGLCMVNKSRSFINDVNAGGPEVWGQILNLGRWYLDTAKAKLVAISARRPLVKGPAPWQWQ